jgi:hypothetical protein
MTGTPKLIALMDALFAERLQRGDWHGRRLPQLRRKWRSPAGDRMLNDFI